MRIKTFSFLAILLMSAIFLNGCFKDTVLEKYSFYRAVYLSRAELRAGIKSTAPRPIQNPGKLFVRGNYVFLNDVNRGIHVIDYSNIAAPKNVAFISIPGNVDLAVKGNYLYADQYTDLVTLDISNPLNVVAVNFDEKVFPQQYSTPDSNLVVADWIKVDTTIRHSEEMPSMPGVIFFSPFVNGGISIASAGGGSQGQGGSMARFALMNDRLYTVSTYELKVFNLGNEADPYYTKNIFAGAGNIETIFPFKNTLFVGSMSGMHIFSVANPDNPVKTGMFIHATACDPVIADDNYAYVTLRSGTVCSSQTNQMDVVNISSLSSPSLLKTYPFSSPHGLSKSGDRIFLCDGSAGLKVLNTQDVNNITVEKTFSGLDAYDVIAINNVAITVAKNGLYFIDYSDAGNIRIAGKISTAN